MRVIYQVDWIDERGRRRRRTFSDGATAEKYERQARSTVLIKRAALVAAGKKPPASTAR